MAADCVTPEAVNFMAKYGRGLICLTLTKERCERLRLPLMVNDNQRRLRHRLHGLDRGRAGRHHRHLRRPIARPPSAPPSRRKARVPRIVVQPGHIFPLMAQPGGVLVRAGHTEAGCDLARLAGFSPAAAIVEILNEDGTMARRPDLEVFARTHGIKIGTIADLIHYRVRHEKAVLRECECELPTAYANLQAGRLPRHHRQRDPSRPDHRRDRPGTSDPGAGASAEHPLRPLRHHATTPAAGRCRTSCDRSPRRARA